MDKRRHYEDELREAGKRDIRESRRRLSGFTVRDFAEAIYGEEFTRLIYGEDGGRIPISEVDLRTSLAGDGIKTRLETKPTYGERTNLSKSEREEARRLLSEQARIAENAALQAAGSPSSDTHVDDMIERISNMTEAERMAVLRKLFGGS